MKRVILLIAGLALLAGAGAWLHRGGDTLKVSTVPERLVEESVGIDLETPAPEETPVLQQAPAVFADPVLPEPGASDLELSPALREVGDLFLTYRERQDQGARPSELRALQDRVHRLLHELHPDDVLDYLVLTTEATDIAMLLRFLDDRLDADRAVWEQAIADSVERAVDDANVLARMAEAAYGRVRDAALRSSIARTLLERACNERLTLLAGRFADGEALPEVEDTLWSRASTSDAAVEALGFVITPEDAPRLIETGRSEAVARALELAFRSTGDEAFRAPIESLARYNERMLK